MAKVQRAITVQFEKGESREETLLGRNYLAVPVVAMVEGVRFGANQDSPELGLAAEFGDTPVIWAYRPLVLNHPKVDGVFVSANSPGVLEDYQFGWTMNPELKGNKLHMEAWIDVARVEELGGVFQETYDRIVAQEDVEVSVGFFSDLQKAKGKFNGQAYSGIWRNIKPDHLAVLSAGTGACSVEDGCGIPRINEKGKIMADLKTDVPKANCSCGGHSETETEDEAPVTQGGLKKMLGDILKPFTMSAFERAEEAHQEEREQNRAILANTINTSLLDGDVRKLISQAGNKKFAKYSYLYGYNNDVAVFETWDDKTGTYQMYQIGVNVNGADVEFVGEPEEVILQTKVVPRDKVELQTNQENDMANETTTKAEPVAQAQTQEAPKVTKEPAGEPKVLTTQEYIDQAPPEVREALSSAVRAQETKKTELIKTLTDHKSNKFSDEFLKTQSIEVLENMVSLLGPSYVGVAPASAPRFQAKDSGVVEAPKVFTKKTEAAA